MSLSSIFILDDKGKNLIYRDYRGNIENSCIEKFYKLVSNLDQELSIKPVLLHHDVTYMFIKHSNLYFVAVASCNANAMIAMSFLVKFLKILEEYFGVVEEESIRDNFVVIYELLDEIMDFGYPQITETKVLKSYIMEASQKLEMIKPPPAVTNAVSWRNEGLKYRKNEVFVDVMEKINLLVNSQGNILSNEVVGVLLVDSHLSGMPELRLGFNDRVLLNKTRKTDVKNVELEDVKFHQCVRLANFEKDRTISFIPPDGKFELMSYRMSLDNKPPFWIQSIIDRYPCNRIEYMIKIKSQFKSRYSATYVDVRIPVPSDSFSPTFKAASGSCRYAPEENAIFWSIKAFTGMKECILRAQVLLPTVTADENDISKSPIKLSFEIPHLTGSGIHIRYLKVVEKSGYHSLPWVRYVSNNGNYEFRTS